MSETEEVIKEFLVESCEGLDRIDADLIALEDDTAPGPRIANIFRTIHTIKGTSGFLAFPGVEAIAHAGENLLSRLRDGALLPNPEIIAALLAMADVLRGLLSNIETSGHEGNAEHEALLALLSRLANGEATASAAGDPAENLAQPAERRADFIELSAGVPEDPETVKEPLEEGRSPTLTDATIRVQVGLLDKLMNLVGELVLARNQILQFAAANDDATLLGATQRLNLLTTELQEGIMKTRMQPIGSIWNKFPRVVRELARACKKEVILEMVGKDTDLDRSIIEAIKDPLTHIVRNSIDHGIEKPAHRVEVGKRREGTLRLHAFHEGGKVNIEISDDGGGIDPVRVRAKAIERGVITAERAVRMSDRELINLIFLPGFSTAEAVSNVSGRGVGMDVVRTNIERIGGTVDLQSVPGAGATVRIKIPLTLAIIPALIVTAAGERYAIPQVSLVELVRLDGSESRGGIETIHGTSLLRLRGNLLPLVYLGELLGDGPHSGDQTEINVVVLQSDERRFGLVVDGIIDTEEIVVKPLGKELKRVTAFAGATIMGDGRVALILDVLGIAQSANVISESRDRALKTGTQIAQATEDHAEALLLFRTTDGRRMAIPLGMVARLEEISSEAIERAGTEEVVQYRGDILPLVRLSSALGGAADQDTKNGALQVIVYSQGGQRIGLVVGEILDIGEEAVRTREVRRGAAPVAIVQGRVTEFLDVGTLLASLKLNSVTMSTGEIN
ncbi:MAG: chemotaxis protein CheA [Polyangiaceae bacterium]|nr:chemotaxis protein CheA [Polyangiaceae bacterium]